MRVPLREFIESALESALRGEGHNTKVSTSVWDDEYLGMQLQQPFGSPVELSSEEAKAIVREAISS